jgi:nitroimidazol reductase NimA-like FMN-containing flavoprotein (pyridoxamine 5'-phosphate oxidase superfamily)
MTKTERIPSKPKTGSAAIPQRLRAFNKNQYFGVLATNNKGRPYTSLIAFVITADQKKVVFATAKETQKFKNLLSTKNVSILIDNRSDVRENLMMIEAITIIGQARHVPGGKIRNELAALFLKKHPDLKNFVQSSTTALIAVRVRRCIHVGKFQTISVWDSI